MFPEYNVWRSLDIDARRAFKPKDFTKIVENLIGDIKDPKGIRCYLCKVKQPENAFELN